MFAVGQKVSLESSRLLLVMVFRIEHSTLRKNMAKGNISDKPRHNITEHFNILEKFPSITTKLVFDI